MRRLALSVLLSAFCGASWMFPIHWIGPLFSLGLVWLVLLQNSRLSRYAVALAYYAAGSVGLVKGVSVFFGPHASLFEGVFLWLGASALLAAGWAFADKSWKAALVLLFDALVPPLAFFDWMSPLTAAGVLFPGGGIYGVVVLLIVVASLSLLRKQPDAWILVGFAVFFCNILYAPSGSPAQWQGVNLQVGPMPANIMQDAARRQRILQETERVARKPGTKVILLPETVEYDWAGNAQQLSMAISPQYQVWLVGMNVPNKPGVMTDSIVAFRRHQKQQVLFSSTFPVPFAMWHPWQKGVGYRGRAEYPAAWWSPVQTIDGKRVWASICYDQLLPAVWLEGVIQHPQVVLLTNNEWWAQGTRIPTIQRNSSWAWVRLMGAASVEAENG